MAGYRRNKVVLEGFCHKVMSVPRVKRFFGRYVTRALVIESNKIVMCECNSRTFVMVACHTGVLIELGYAIC
jgi:hypothetical protein